MNDQMKLILAQMQLENLLNLVGGNEYEKYLKHHFTIAKVEIERQLSHYMKTDV